MTATAQAVSGAVKGMTVMASSVPNSGSTGFGETLCQGSFWAGAILQILIAGGTVWSAYLLFTMGLRNDRREKKENACGNLSRFLDLIFIVRSEIMDGILGAQKGAMSTPSNFLERDIWEDMKEVWTLLSGEAQEALIEARAKMLSIKGAQSYLSPKHMENFLESMNDDLGACATALQKDLAKLGKVVIV